MTCCMHPYNRVGRPLKGAAVSTRIWAFNRCGVGRPIIPSLKERLLLSGLPNVSKEGGVNILVYGRPDNKGPQKSTL